MAQALDINRRTIYTWLERFHSGGFDALRRKARPGASPKLNAEQMSQLFRMIALRAPRQYEFPFALWTRALVRELIRREFQVALSEVSVGRVLRTLGLSPQRPLRRAIERDPQRVQAWLQEEFPALRARAKQENALIFFGDETGMRSDYHAGTTWAPVGVSPVVARTGARFGLNMISAVSAQGLFRFMLHEGPVNAQVFATFLEHLVAGMDRKIILVLDQHRIHRARIITETVAALDGRLEIVFLPAYSPQLNPDEGVWARVKQEVGKQIVLTKRICLRKPTLRLKS